MDLTDKIVKGLIPGEPVKILSLQSMGDQVAVRYMGVNSQRVNNVVCSADQIAALEVVSQDGTFSFDGDPERFKLFAEAERIHSAYQFDPLFAVNCSIIDPLPHQVEAVYRYLLPLPQIRFLLADDTGAGKTIMAGLLLKELMMRGFVERILIITPGGLTKQWQEDELGLKFNIPFRLANRAAFNSEPNIFSNANRIVTSIDFIRNEDVLNVLQGTQWDMVIVDEAHKLSAYEYGSRRYVSKRYDAVHKLAKQTEHLLLLTATPHRGRRDTFRNLLQLLDEDIFSSDTMVNDRINELQKTGTNKFFIRRLKEQMKDWDNQPLFKKRTTQTIKYELTKEEKRLYNRVTDYLTKKKEEARLASNIHVSLALMVMQRRLASSIRAIMLTLKKRYEALNGVVEIIRSNPTLWKQRHKLEDFDVKNLDDFDELEDDERDDLENIMQDPRKFKLFTTAKTIQDLKEEAEQVKQLYEMAHSLHRQQQEEQKFRKLKEVLTNKKIFDSNEKLVIFTEHKDTLDYLEERLGIHGGFEVATIHGGKSVDERRRAQHHFRNQAQILIATDAAGEGINLQFCRYLINWDIPWNPNRLEQRMGRIHRYGQESDVLVFNLVAANTREGKVLKKLLDKLDIIRDQMGDDRVYDVISDVFEDVSLDQVMDAVMNHRHTKFSERLDEDDTSFMEKVKEKITEQKEKLGHTDIDYSDARILRNDSLEKRLQPYFIQEFFKKAFASLEGRYEAVSDHVFRITRMPAEIKKVLKDQFNIGTDLRDILFCFDKDVFLDQQQAASLGNLHYINPGNPVFDALIQVCREAFREDMLKGTVLISAEDPEPYYAYFVKSQIVDQRPTRQVENVADEEMAVVLHDGKDFEAISAGALIDLFPPNAFARKVEPPDPIEEEAVKAWAFQKITTPQMQRTAQRIAEDMEARKAYLQRAFDTLIMDLNSEINDLQGKILQGNKKVEERLEKMMQYLGTIQERRVKRLERLDKMTQLSQKIPEVLGCAYVMPLSDVEYENHYGMKRDDEVEVIAMRKALEWEAGQGRLARDVSTQNEGYDIVSENELGVKYYIEVKGRASDGHIMLSQNEKHRLSQLGKNAWLYIVTHCKTAPVLHRLQDPGNTLRFEQISKGVQYLLKKEEWVQKWEYQEIGLEK